MEFSVTTVDGSDFGTVAIRPERDDQFEVSGYTGEVSISFPLYNHEAARLIEALREIAETPSLA